MLINAFFAMLAGSGGAPRAAISMGKKDNKTAEKIFGNSFALLILMAVILTVVFFTFAPQLLTLFGASEKTLPYGVAYARIYILGSIFVLIVLGMNPFITTQGFAKISMMTTVIGAVINIILDPIFYLRIQSWCKRCRTCHCFKSGSRSNMDSPLLIREEDDPSS